MHHKFAKYAQYAFASMVPMTLMAFLIAKIAKNVDPRDKYAHINVYDILGLLITCAGVIISNIFD